MSEKINNNIRSLGNNVIERFYRNDGIGVPCVFSPWRRASSNKKIIYCSGDLSIHMAQLGAGKTMALSQIAISSMVQYHKVLFISLELSAENLLYRMGRQASGLRDPEITYLQAMHSYFESNLWIDTVSDPDAILNAIEVAHERHGVKTIIIDSLNRINFSNPIGHVHFVKDLLGLARDLDIHIHLSVQAYEEQGRQSIKADSVILDIVDNVYVINRALGKEESIVNLIETAQEVPQEINDQFDLTLACSKQRNSDFSRFWIGLWFDKESLQFLSLPTDLPAVFIRKPEEYLCGAACETDMKH